MVLGVDTDAVEIVYESDDQVAAELGLNDLGKFIISRYSVASFLCLWLVCLIPLFLVSLLLILGLFSPFTGQFVVEYIKKLMNNYF